MSNKANILFVDGDKESLASLAKVFRQEGYGIMLAESGECGLELLKHNGIGVVVAGQPQKGMGVEFLKRVKDSYPDTSRVMLADSAEASELVRAVNEAGICGCCAKPLDFDELKSVVKEAAALHSANVESRLVHEAMLTQNAELCELNKALGGSVEEKSRKLMENFYSFVGLCADIMEFHDQLLGGHGKRVAVFSRGLGQRLGIKGAELESLWAAALLHEIGLIGVPREVLDKSEGELVDSERALIRNNPALSQEIISKIDILKQAGLIVRSCMESYDGSGYPDRLRGREINHCSRVLSICREYDRLRHAKRPYSRVEALAVIERGRARRFDPDVTEAFIKFISELKEEDENELPGHSPNSRPVIMHVDIHDIAPGMVLSRPLVSGRGRLLVGQGTVLSEALIEKVLNFHRIDPITEPVQVLVQLAA
jgi:response regulator RpfG family c-di-GMP phosphodiesterase